MRLRANRAQTVRIHGANLEVTFADGEEIRTEMSAKFTLAVIERELAEAGWSSIVLHGPGRDVRARVRIRSASAMPNRRPTRMGSRCLRPGQAEPGSRTSPPSRSIAAQPRADRERCSALRRASGSSPRSSSPAPGSPSARPGRDRVPGADVLALPRPHPQLAVRVAGGQQPLGPPARLPALHALPLVAAPAQPPPRATPATSTSAGPARSTR